ncbi:MAG: cytochrome P450 [Linnemannia gamsii]|nr:MAG: cytochrome P450 [Linnemannia gamsii]
MAIISTLVQSLDLVTTLTTLLVLFASYILYHTYIYPTYVSPLRHIPGPPNKSRHNKYNIPFLGLFFDVIRKEAGVTFREWTEQYGGIVCYQGLFNKQIVHIANPEAIQHVFGTHAYKYPKPDRVVRVMSSVLGMGLVLVEGDIHRKLRNMINPAFSYSCIKEMVPDMIGPSECLSKMWEKRVEDAEDKSIELNVVHDLSACTLDVIGRVGFGFDFEGLTKPDNETVGAYNEFFSTKVPTILQFCRHFVPYYTKLPFKHNLDRMRTVQSIDRVAHQIVQEKRAQAAVSDKDDQAKDIISILIHANDKSYDGLKLTDEDLKEQIKTFIFAGHETTSGAVTWMLHILSTHPDVQRKMRQEMLEHIGRPTDNNFKTFLSYDSLHALPYLNVCVKEILRIIPPVHATSRVAAQDDVILGYHIPKGTEIYLAPATLHKLKSVWGEDAEEFKPERWMDPSSLTEEQRRTTKTVTSDMLWAYIPFLTGPRNCIGSKLSLIEMKVMLYYLLINLEYHPVPGFKFRKAARVTFKPSPGMNLIIKPFKDASEHNVESMGL